MLQVVPFGSYVNGLQMHSSDCDMVVTGVLQPDDEKGGKPVVFNSSCLQVASAPVAARFALDTLPACTVWHQHSTPLQFRPKGCQPDHLSTEHAQGWDSCTVCPKEPGSCCRVLQGFPRPGGSPPAQDCSRDATQKMHSTRQGWPPHHCTRSHAHRERGPLLELRTGMQLGLFPEPPLHSAMCHTLECRRAHAQACLAASPCTSLLAQRVLHA